MRIRFRQGYSSAGPNGSRHEGQVYDVSDAEGEALIAAGAAVSLDPPKPRRQVEIETTEARVQVAAEVAVTRKGRGGRGR